MTKQNLTKTVFLAIASLLWLLPASADEGMWLPSLISNRIEDMRSKGFELSAEDIYSINQASMKDAVVLFAGYCTGEIVSDKGLVLTNHHCGFEAIQSHSTIDHDYLTDGFWAKDHSEELPNEGLWAAILVRMEDITERLAAGEKGEDIVAKAEAEGKGYKASIEQMYYGNQQFLFLYERFDDVRLVGTPPSSIGKFGGDTDNWIWPRHTGDFSIFRIYAGKDNKPAAYSTENVPYQPKRHFEISTEGIGEGDFTMIYGFPGNTQQYITVDAVEYVQKVSDPMKIDLRTRRLDIIRAASEADPAVRIQYASKYANIANAWKKWQGEVLGLERMNTIEVKKEYEARFSAWAEDKAEYKSLLDSMHLSYEKVIPWYYMEELKNESVRTIELAQFAARSSAALSGDKRARDQKLSEVEALYKDFDVEVDRKLTVAVLKGFEQYCPKENYPAELKDLIAKHGSVEAYVDYLYANSLFVSKEKMKSATAKSAASDPATQLYNIFRNTQGRLPRNLSNVQEIERWYRPYLKALMEFDPQRAFFPDANMTLRVAYGPIAGYEYADGEYHTPQTTLEGIIAKDNPEIYDYNIPQQLRDIYKSKDYGRWGIQMNGRFTVPVCFLASNQTTGGNSGSPVINGKGQLIGINFDRTWRSTMSDIAFDPTICRNIAVDIRYVLFVVDKVGGAEWIANEMVGE